MQRLQFFLSEADWDAQAINVQRLALLVEQPALASHPRGVLVLDDTGDRKDGRSTAHVARQYLGSVGKTDNGIVAVTTLWADERCYWPVSVQPYTPESRLLLGRKDPAFRTKPQIALALVEQARNAGIEFEAVVADCFYGDNQELEWALHKRDIPYLMARRGKGGLGWAPADLPHSFMDAGQELPPRAWRSVTRYFRDGHTEQWWAAELEFFDYGPHREMRAIVVTTDSATLPPLSTWYLSTNLPLEKAPLSHLVCCAFSFCWWHEAQQGLPCVSEQHTSQAPKRARKKNQVSTSKPGAGLLAATLRRVRSWLAPWKWLNTWWGTWRNRPPPPELNELLAAIAFGLGIKLYLRE